MYICVAYCGFELGSKVYDIVEQTCCLYHAMNASMFDVEGQGSPGEQYGEPSLIQATALATDHFFELCFTVYRMWGQFIMRVGVALKPSI